MAEHRTDVADKEFASIAQAQECSVPTMLADADFDQVCGGLTGVPGNEPLNAGFGLGNAFQPDRGNSGITASGSSDTGVGISEQQSGHMFNGNGVVTAFVVGGNAPF